MLTSHGAWVIKPTFLCDDPATVVDVDFHERMFTFTVDHGINQDGVYFALAQKAMHALATVLESKTDSSHSYWMDWMITMGCRKNQRAIVCMHVVLSLNN